jgi:thymidylate synthase (FAD)
MTISCLDKGFVDLVDVMPSDKEGDRAICQMARVSRGRGEETKSREDDRVLIRYLMRHRHTTPFEGVEFKFHCKMPIFVARQWIRHRTANVNEISGRYSVLKDDFYIPTPLEVRKQDPGERQKTEENVEEGVGKRFGEFLEQYCAVSYDWYKKCLGAGICREQARMILPLNLYTEWYWKIDLHNLLHFLALRCDKHAQYEIRVYGEAILGLIKPIVPMAVEAWEDYSDMRGGIRLSRLEIDAFKEMKELDSNNKREKMEWEEKAKRLEL